MTVASSGTDLPDLLLAANAQAKTSEPLPSGSALRFRADPGPPGAAAEGPLVRLEAEGIVLLAAPSPAPADDPIAALVPPAGEAGRALMGARLATGGAARARALAALGFLLGGDPAAAATTLEPAGDATGVRVLRAWAALARRDWAAVHSAAEGIAADPDVGPVVRLATGAALRADGNPREAVRDFEAAAASPSLRGLASLLLAEACEARGVRLPERAAAAYAAAHEAMPDDVAAALGHARSLALAAKDLPAARREVEALLGRHPDLVGGWRLLSGIRALGETEEDAAEAVRALERVAALRPKDPRTWADLGSARWDRAGRGGGVEDLDAAAAAFATQAELAPDDGLAWFNRGGAIHQAALNRPLNGSDEAFRQRLREARVCYAKAFGSTLGLKDAARLRFNIGLVGEYLPGDPPPAGLPATPSEAFSGAIRLDPTYAPAALAHVASRIADGDASAAALALNDVPRDADAGEKAALEAAIAYLSGDADRARSLLEGPGNVVVGPGDPRLALTRVLLVFGHRRAVIALLDGPLGSPPLLVVRARARAALRDLDGLKKDLDLLRVAEPSAAKQLRRDDPDVVAALGPAPD